MRGLTRRGSTRRSCTRTAARDPGRGRAPFGGEYANSAGTIENPALTYPTQVQGLDAFMQGIALDVAGTGSPRLNASRFAWGAMSFSRGGSRASTLDIYDAAGRRLASLEPSLGAGGVSWRWDGRDASGRSVRGAIVFARPRDGQGGTARVTLLP
jgi:hypothetical protein